MEISMKEMDNVLRNSTVLYVEGDSKYNIEISKILSPKFHQVLSAQTINEAVDIFNNNHIDIIISEVYFEHKNGLGFIKGIRKIDKDIPIIVTSVVKDTKYLLESIRLNLIEYIIKPIDLKIFREAIYRSAIKLYELGRYKVVFYNGTIYNVKKRILLDKDGHEIHLTKNELRMLDILVYNKNIILSIYDLKDMIWENSYDVTDEAFKSLLNRLRSKIGKETIENISGTGYRIKLHV